jgi:ubiquinone/menaquinone biosynthesis C-methylase UbiE
MRFSLSGFIYRIFIDPLISGLRKSVAEHVDPSHRVIDVACGTGALSSAMAEKAMHVTGIDLSEDMIITAQRTAKRRGATNVFFELLDASDLSRYRDGEYDLAVTSMAIHQFETQLAIKILAEMKRISGRVVIADYKHNMPAGLSKRIAWGIERMAGGDHYRNFRIYMQNGGAPWFAKQAGMRIVSEKVSRGVFTVLNCEPI